MVKLVTRLSILAILCCGCADVQTSDAAGSADDQVSIGTEEELQRRLEVRQRAVRRFPEQAAQPPSVHITGEVPENLLEAVKADMAERLGVSAEDFSVLKGESIIWNDGSLGCARPGEVYTQALVPGYWIILLRGNEEYDYRATERGYFFLCELPRTLIPRNETQ